jgi:hypothetical protein
MTRDHRATKTCRSSNDGHVSASAADAVPAQKGADVDDHPSHFQARKRRPPGVLSTLIQRVPGRRLETMTTHTEARLLDPLSAATYPHSGPLLRAKHPVGRHEQRSVALLPSSTRPGGRGFRNTVVVTQAIAMDAGSCPPPCGMGATAGTPGREGG